MKRLFSKRSGFTLVEIIIAFAIFAIMASMIVQVLNLMVRQKVRNKNLEDSISIQSQQYVARAKDYSFEDSKKEADSEISLKFKDGDTDLVDMNLEYQLKNWEPDNPRNGINYFVVGNGFDYDAELSFTETPDDDDDDEDDASKGGSSQMSRFDTRLTGTKGIKSIRIDITKSTARMYTVTVTVDDSDVDAAISSHSQVSLFFAENKPNGKAIKVVGVNPKAPDNIPAKDENTLKKVKKCGDNGVNVHCEGSSGFGGSSVTFTVELEKDVAANEICFGENVSSNTYYPFTYTYKDKNGNDKTSTYVNIFGAYQKSSTSAPTEGEPAE